MSTAPDQPPRPSLPPLPGVKHIVAVASGKGGVGKSTTAANLALALSQLGHRVGVLDADIYGPSLAILFGVEGKPQTDGDKHMLPVERLGLQLMSIGFLVPPSQAMIWRGPMASQALDQLLHQTRWRDLDVLIVDMPPGTGDIQLSLSQRVPLTGAVIVTTPQDLALIDARKGVAMFEKVGVPILGLVENMAVHVCSQCGHQEHIFGQHGAERLAKDIGVQVLSALPLDIRIREQADSGKPTVAADPQGPLSAHYLAMAQSVWDQLTALSRDHKRAFPTIKISKT